MVISEVEALSRRHVTVECTWLKPIYLINLKQLTVFFVLRVRTGSVCGVV